MIVISWQWHIILLRNHDVFLVAYCLSKESPPQVKMSLLTPGTDWDGEALSALAWSEQRFSFS
jgi:hypothetical protein